MGGLGGVFDLGILALLCAALISGGIGALLAIVVLLGALAVACWPVHGQPPVAWLPIVGGWLARRACGPRWSPAPEHGVAREVPAPVAWPGTPATPGPPHHRPRAATTPAGVSLLDVPGMPGDPAMGMVRDRRSGTWVAAVAMGARSFTLIDPDDQRRRLGSWGALLAGLARPASPVTRVQWLESVAPADPAGLRVPSGAAAGARADYAEVVAAAGPAARHHRTLVVVAVRPRRGGGDPATVLRREVRLVQGQLANADLVGGSPLDLDALGAAIRCRFDPGPGAGRGVWPLATDEAWSAVRVDGGWHATYWIAEWPRVETGPDFLVPLLLAGQRRTVAITMGPVPAAWATRQVESARTASMADDELRRRAGFLATARRQRQAEGVERREAELADGHAEYRFSGYVTVSGDDRPALDASCPAPKTPSWVARSPRSTPPPSTGSNV